MVPFNIVFPSVLALTVLSGAAATLIVLMGQTRGGSAQRKLVERLSHIALLGAATTCALLTATDPA